MGGRNFWWVWGLLAIVSAAAIITLCENAFDWNAGIDEMIFRDFEHRNTRYPPGRFAPGTAICILLLSGALLLLDGFRRLSYGLALATILVTVVALTGYRYNLPSLYGAVRYTSMALHTTGGFFILCIGVLAARPDRGLTALLIDSWKQKSTRWWRKRLFWMTRRLRRRYVTSWTVVVVVQDNGVGLPSDFDAQTTNTLGFTSAEVLTQQLGGECGFSEAPGFAFTLRFPREAGH